MNLVIDVGNTHTVLGLFSENSDQKLVASFRLQTDRVATSDELRFRVKNILEAKDVHFNSFKTVILGTVVPEMDKEWKRAFEDKVFIQITPDSPWSFKNVLPHPQQVGTDRLANSEAALDIELSAAIIVDAGTATTFDVVDKHQDAFTYLGGVIAPGVGISLEALVSHASRLRSVSIKTAPQNIKTLGNSTDSALQSGVIHGFCAMVDGIVERLRIENPTLQNCRVIATGGWSSLLKTSSKHVTHFDTDLTLRGFQIVGKRAKT
jgi:type III pantothenate kinase